jgi:cell division protein FtsQ
MQLISNRPPKRRRSQTRLGTTNEVVAPALRLSLAPIQAVWQDKGARIPSAIVAALLCWALVYCFTSDRFYIFGATVAGNIHVSAQEIYQKAAFEGESIFFLNRKEVEHRIEQLPNVKAAQVDCQLPATVHIDVVEREPAYLWQAGQMTYRFDNEGFILETVGLPPDSITFVDIDAQPRQPGDRISQAILSAASELRKWLPDEKVFQWSQAQGLSFRHADGYPVYIGQADNLQKKMSTLHALTDDLRNRDIRPRFIDLRFSQPYYR